MDVNISVSAVCSDKSTATNSKKPRFLVYLTIVYNYGYNCIMFKLNCHLASTNPSTSREIVTMVLNEREASGLLSNRQ